MRWSSALSLGLALAAATLGLKALAIARAEPVDDAGAYRSAVARRLVAAGFAATVDPRGFVVATRGRCRLKARDLPPVGSARLAYERLGAAFGPTRYAWRGTWRADPPSYGPLLLFYVQRELARLRIATPRPVIAAVAAGPGCRTVPATLFAGSVTQR